MQPLPFFGFGGFRSWVAADMTQKKKLFRALSGLSSEKLFPLASPARRVPHPAMRQSGSGQRRSQVISGQEVAPRKSMGQNFLVDEEVARWIADQIYPDGAVFVVEPGPGLGAMTKHLLGRPQQLLLIEKDHELAPELQRHFGNQPGVTVLHEDATRVDKRSWYQHGDVRVVGNLPYSVGGEILKHFLTPPTPVTSAVFMLQKEVCDRLAARVEDDSYGALSVLVQRDWQVEMLRVIPPEVFKPRPKVDSAVVRFTPRDPASLPVCDRRQFERLVRLGFGQRRKQLKNLLPEAPGGWQSLADALGKPVTLRAEELSLEQWVQLTRHYEQRSGADFGQKATEMFDVVNDRNEVTGQLPRGEVHARGLLHRAVHVFIINSRAEIFLQKRSHLKDVSPLKWDSSAAGHLDVGESYAACAIRETHEEAGIRIEGTECVAELPAGTHTDFEFVELHVVHHNGPIKCPPEEVAYGEWFPPEMIANWVAARPQDFAKGFVTCWKAYSAR
jgi:16S rRNA (adenine1518-N6/adenine1519-N6)-dimethyltransferase